MYMIKVRFKFYVFDWLKPNFKFYTYYMLDIQYSTVSNTKQIGRQLMDLIDIKSPADLKGLSLAELTELTAQARQFSTYQ